MEHFRKPNIRIHKNIYTKTVYTRTSHIIFNIISAWNMSYAVCTEVTSWWWTGLFEICRGQYNWNTWRI